jgi:hypothetical protein
LAQTRSLFRTVQREELDDIAARQVFRTTRTSAEGKAFWTVRDDAARFARLLARLDIGPSWIVEIRISARAMERLTAFTADGRSARYVEEESLGWFNGVVMDLRIPAEHEGHADG